jgi:hypothetical protein
MSFDYTHYVPCLRWKLGEYQAIWRLSNTTKRAFTPLIEVPGIGYDFAKGRESKTVDEHLASFVGRVHKKWGTSTCFIDMNLIDSSKRMANGIHPFRFIFDGLRAMDSQAIPVTGLHRDAAYQKEVKRILSKGGFGACLRVTIEQATSRELKQEIDTLLSRLELKHHGCDLIIDLGAPDNFIPLDGFLMVIQRIINKLPWLNDWRTFTIMGTSFPESMSSIRTGVISIPRYEWQLYKILVASFRKAKLRLPAFGDYAISHPNVPELDWRVVKPSVKIRYTIDDRWCVAKGRSYKDYGFGQYQELSKQILNSGHFYGSSFSWGDEYIKQCANGGSTGNLFMWVEVDTNHHIEKVTRDIASFYAS